MNRVFRVDNRIVQEADNFAKETGLNFRDCLDILVRAYLANKDRMAGTQETETVAADGVERLQPNHAVV